MSNSYRPSEGSWLDRIFGSRSHPDSFVCGVRILEGNLTAESTRWKYKSSGVDGFIDDGVVTLHHGAGNDLRLRVDPEPRWDGRGPKPRPGHRALTAVEIDSGARVLLAVPPFHLFRFGIGDE